MGAIVAPTLGRPVCFDGHILVANNAMNLVWRRCSNRRGRAPFDQHAIERHVVGFFKPLHHAVEACEAISLREGCGLGNCLYLMVQEDRMRIVDDDAGRLGADGLADLSTTDEEKTANT